MKAYTQTGNKSPARHTNRVSGSTFGNFWQVRNPATHGLMAVISQFGRTFGTFGNTPVRPFSTGDSSRGMAQSQTSGSLVRSEMINLWRELAIDVEPRKARVTQYDRDASGYVGMMEISHDDRTWTIGVSEDRTAERVDGPAAVPEWVDELLFFVGVDEVVRDE